MASPYPSLSSPDNDTSSGAQASSEGRSPGQFPSSSGPSPRTAPTQKRARLLYSCVSCRNSKLKCDRLQPCGKCIKKGRPDGCKYTPQPSRPKATMLSVRLKRLEGIEREMMDEGGGGVATAPPGARSGGKPTQSHGQVVKGGRVTTYVGATHFMAMLDDIEGLKDYFDEEDTAQESYDTGLQGPNSVLLNMNGRMSRDDILDVLPAQHIMDRLVHRFFLAGSPAMHIVHRPTFLRQYTQFCKDPDSASLEWIALLLIILALAIFFSTFNAPHELQSDSDVPPMDRYRQLRAAAGCALVASNYTNPSPMTIQPLILYVEAEFLVNRASQLQCYLLSSVCIRIMVKMGLHRDPSKLPNITPYDGEMRRRFWNLAIQVDLLVSFHLGLPSIIHGIDTDTRLPHNMVDDDFDENSTKLPPPRPDSEYTPLTYPIWKSALCRIFGQIVKQSHALEPPSHSEVMRLDELLEEKWKMVPEFIKLKPMRESLADSAGLLNQRFGLAAMYQKSRCILHRRYLVEPVPKEKHAYSRRACLDAALTLLDYQHTVYHGTLPGGILRQNGWFITSLAIHEYLMAGMVVYLAIQNKFYSEPLDDTGSTDNEEQLPSRDDLCTVLRRSLEVWEAVSRDSPTVKKAAVMMQTMVNRIEGPFEESNAQTKQASPSMESLMLNEDSVSPWRLSESNQSDNGQYMTPAWQQSMEPSEGYLQDFSGANSVPITPLRAEPALAWLEIGGSSDAMDWNSFDRAIRDDSSGTSRLMLEEGWQAQGDVFANGADSTSAVEPELL
ncbi:hypothetical protein GQ53DRAFT_679854 [Thozetella sp. PMI_491]|nr:hypothetical protein GQ53DRAFT_679854 [Thozetella sp. PMI_491]